MKYAFPNALLQRLPKARGRYVENAPLGMKTWFRSGGPAEVMFLPADREDLIAFLGRKPAEVTVTVIGLGSNLLIRDGGVPGVVIRLGQGFSEIDIGDGEVTAGAAVFNQTLAQACLDSSVAGMEFLVGIPGTIGGALRMNAGAFGREMKDVTTAAEAVDGAGVVHRLTCGEIGFSYRCCAVPEDWIFLAAALKGVPGKEEEIRRRMAEIQNRREESQPLRLLTGGSTFINPPGEKAWELIDRAGCRGLRRGAAMVSERHCNFLVNTGSASAADLEALGEEVRRRVRTETGVELEWEIRRLGVPLQEERAQS